MDCARLPRIRADGAAFCPSPAITIENVRCGSPERLRCRAAASTSTPTTWRRNTERFERTSPYGPEVVGLTAIPTGLCPVATVAGVFGNSRPPEPMLYWETLLPSLFRT